MGNDSIPQGSLPKYIRRTDVNFAARGPVDTTRTDSTLIKSPLAVRSVFTGFKAAFLEQFGIVNAKNPNDPYAGLKNLNQVIAKNCDSPKVEGQSHMPDNVCDAAREARADVREAMGFPKIQSPTPPPVK